ncbi:hypothetical protein PVAND_002819 [Polypedilum vanderplanki]|uniref:Pre-rRNA-processing protein Ipi1 N-terminal domain-containing protein n=1 Tax=Polypedilum vanderplanki TaxID=319348 RepID=A0A9J6BTU0_POLVA|nr:hypothetical protein PVAND_002819 [Polypedilum vanderplanki]
MGKHKKFLKSEKAKVKLKGNKLKDHQNVTKTDFKVRKIIIPEQLKNVQQLDSGERKKHNIRDCLTRLGNSASAEAISNLKEIILYQPEDFQKHLEAIIKTVSNLSLSIEKNDRKECFKIMDLVFSQINEINLKPFFPILTKYLTCAMTHIKSAIQEDSLLMLDLLLKHAPKFVAFEKDNILKPYLDLVSKTRTDNTSERTLSMQMGNKITNIKWRKSVLERLILFLKCINNQRINNNAGTKKNTIEDIIAQDSSKSNNFLGNPFVNLTTVSNVSLSMIENNSKKVTAEYDNDINEKTMDKYIHTIMPLMFEIWIELVGTDKNASASIITQENALILKSIMDIIIELFSMIESQNALKLQFLKKYQDNFDKHLITHFPYLQTGINSNKKVAVDSGGDKCIYQNLSIAILFFNFGTKNHSRFGKCKEKIFKFVEENIEGWRAKDQEFNSLMKKLIRTVFSLETRKTFPNECNNTFNVLIKKCNVDQSTYDPKMALVCEIIQNSGNSKKDSIYDNLLTKMIEAIANMEHVPIHLIKTISIIAKTGNQILYEALEKNAICILNNLQNKLKITGTLTDDQEQWKMEIINLFYWINNKEILQDILSHTSVNKGILFVKLDELIRMKLQI